MNVTRRASIAAALASAAATPAAAGVAPNRFVLPDTRVIPITSAINGVAYELFVSAPASPSDGAPRPLVLTLDADYQFPIVASHTRHLAERGQAPHAVIASIAYAGPRDRARYQLNRSRDYTPLHSSGGYSAAADAATGGGVKFAAVIESEILPAITAACGPLSDIRVFVGHSFGGLFGAWICGERPTLFNRYVLVSPSLWFGDYYVPMRAADKKLYQPREGTRLFVGVGALEEQPENGRPMVSDARRFADLLLEHWKERADVRFQIFADETHASIFPAAFSTGLRTVLS